MADLLEDYDHSVATSTAPRSNISAAEVAQPKQELGEAFDKLHGALDAVAEPLAEQAAAHDLDQQRVTRNADGSISVLNPSNSLIFGDAGTKYTHAVQVGTLAQVSDQMHQDFTELHQKFPLDPAAFRTAAQAHLEAFQA